MADNIRQPQIGLLDPNQTVTVPVQAAVPNDTPAGATASSTITVTSVANPAVQQQVGILTTADVVRGMELETNAAAVNVEPGTEALYTLTITNQGNTTETFDILVDGLWQVTADTLAGPIGSGKTASFSVKVLVPIETPGGQADTTQVTARSKDDPALEQTLVLTTSASEIAKFEVTMISEPDMLQPGETAEYILQITNLGNIVDTFDVDVDMSGHWPVDAPETLGPIGIGEQMMLHVHLSVPADAPGDVEYTLVVDLKLFADTSVGHQEQISTPTCIVIAFTLDPLTAKESALPGAYADYLMTVTNLGNTVESFDVAFGENTGEWDAVASDLTGLSQLAAGASTTFKVSVLVPSDAFGDDSNMTSVTLRSQSDANMTRLAMLTTTAARVVKMKLNAATTSGSALPGGIVEYQLSVTNLGNTPDSYVIGISKTWSVEIVGELGELSPGATGTFAIKVTVPPETLSPINDIATVSVTSVADSSVANIVKLATVAEQLSGLALAITDSAESALPGETATYSLTVTNMGNGDDNIDVTLAGNWSAFADPIGPLSPGQNQLFKVYVEVDSTASGGSTDTTLVTLTSQADPSVSTTAKLVTTAEQQISLSLTAAESRLKGKPGETIEYELTVTNLGNAVDTFRVDIASLWKLEGPLAIGPIDPTGSETFSVNGTVPVGTSAGTEDVGTVSIYSGESAVASIELVTVAAQVPAINPLSHGTVKLWPTKRRCRLHHFGGKPGQWTRRH